MWPSPKLGYVVIDKCWLASDPIQDIVLCLRPSAGLPTDLLIDASQQNVVTPAEDGQQLQPAYALAGHMETFSIKLPINLNNSVLRSRTRLHAI